MWIEIEGGASAFSWGIERLLTDEHNGCLKNQEEDHTDWVS
jgi:hypothetical protein